MRQILRTVLILAVISASINISALAQTPTIFSVADVVVGNTKLQTRYFSAVGKWSDTGDDVGPLSVAIRCYKRFGFCSVSTANLMMTNRANLSVTDFDVFRWDSRELIAVDGSNDCKVDTLRADFVTKKVTLSSSEKGSPGCKGWNKPATALLLGTNDVFPKAKK